MNKKKVILCLFFVITIIFLYSGKNSVLKLEEVNESENSELLSGASGNDCISNKTSSIQSYLKGVNNMEVLDVRLEKETYVTGIRNFNQTSLNNYYKNSTNKYVTGTCTLVACTEMMDYYGNFLKEFEISSNENLVFEKVFTACVNNGLTTYENGTSIQNVGYCLRKSFETCGSTRSSESDWWNPKQDIINAVSKNEPIMLDLVGHSVVVCGKANYYVDYEEEYFEGFIFGQWKKRTITRLEEFAIVCEGWGRNDFSLVYFPKITNYLQDGIQATWATGRSV